MNLSNPDAPTADVPWLGNRRPVSPDSAGLFKSEPKGTRADHWMQVNVVFTDKNAAMQPSSEHTDHELFKLAPIKKLMIGAN